MANEHPFQSLFETLGRPPAAHAPLVNLAAFRKLCEVLSVSPEKPGRCILLRAPRAGHGKTHLLARVQHQLAETHEFIPLTASSDCRVDAASVTDDILRRLVRGLPASGGLCVLDLITRRLLASALQPLVAAGEVPCQDREGALAALRTRPVKTFDFHHPSAVTAQWARKNFDVLGQRLSLDLSQRAGLPLREVAFWVDTLFRFAAAPPENATRVRTLVESAQTGGGAQMERLEALLGLLTLLMRVVLVADDVEGFSTDESAALRLAAFLTSLRQSIGRLDVILSLNEDIWQSTFIPRLSGGLEDRLSEVVIHLETLSHPEMVALLDARVPGLGARVLERVDVTAAGAHARGLIRAAGVAWLKALDQDASHRAPQPAAPVSAHFHHPAQPIESRPPPEVQPIAPARQPQAFRLDGELEPKPQAASAPFLSQEPSPRVDSPAVPLPFSGSPSSSLAPSPSFTVATEEFSPSVSSFQSHDDWTVTAPEMTPEPKIEPPVEAINPPPAKESLGIDSLLRQFRERYGR